MNALVPLLSQVKRLWDSDSRAETVIAIAMAVIAGILALAPQIRMVLGQVI